MFQTVVDFLGKFGPLGLFIHSFLDSIIFPIPAFFLQVSLSMLNPSTALWLATVATSPAYWVHPSVYYLGKVMGKSILYKILKKEWIDAATDRFQKNGEAAILIGSFTPIPFKVFTILSGCLNFPLWRLIGYAAIGRGLKFYIVGLLFYLYGHSAKGMVKMYPCISSLLPCRSSSSICSSAKEITKRRRWLTNRTKLRLKPDRTSQPNQVKDHPQYRSILNA